MHLEKCPHCNTPWEEEETIYEYFLAKYLKDYLGELSDQECIEKARKTAKVYGCTLETPKHFGKDVVGIEDPMLYDGISFWECQKCETVFDRWTMKEVSQSKNGRLFQNS